MTFVLFIILLRRAHFNALSFSHRLPPMACFIYSYLTVGAFREQSWDAVHIDAITRNRIVIFIMSLYTRSLR